MTENRKFHRVKFSSVISQEDFIHHGQLVNISMGGALISLGHGSLMPFDNEYDLTIYIEGDEFPLQFTAELVSVTFALAGMKFIAFDDDTETRLAELVEKLAFMTDAVKDDQVKIRRRFSERICEE